MPEFLSNYLTSLRKKSGLDQHELAYLLATSASTLSKVERDEVPPPADLLMGIEVVFGAAARRAFPRRYRNLEREIMARAARLFERLERREGQEAEQKRRHLLNMIERTEPEP
jgi:transcriptional regulator with XRE-family HTH domain